MSGVITRRCSCPCCFPACITSGHTIQSPGDVPRYRTATLSGFTNVGCCSYCTPSQDINGVYDLECVQSGVPAPSGFILYALWRLVIAGSYGTGYSATCSVDSISLDYFVQDLAITAPVASPASATWQYGASFYAASYFDPTLIDPFVGITSGPPHSQKSPIYTITNVNLTSARCNQALTGTLTTLCARGLAYDGGAVSIA